MRARTSIPCIAAGLLILYVLVYLALSVNGCYEPAVIGAGATHGINPAELLSSQRAGAVFDDLRDQYSYVLVDTPPSSEVADAGIVGQLADAALIVVRMGKTPQPVVKRTIQTLQASQVNLLGCVLAGVEQSASPYGYYHDYVSRSLSES